MTRYPPPAPGGGVRLVDRPELALHEEFWAVYLQLARLLPEAWEGEAPGLDADRLGDWYGATLTSATEWPVLPLPLPGGRAVRVVFRNAPEDAGVDFLVDDPAWGSPLVLARLEGHFSGPGLRWAEARAIAGAPGDGARGLTRPWARLLLLLPLVTEVDLPEDAGSRLLDALREGGATVPWLATLAAGGPGGIDVRRSGWWEAVRWRRDAYLGWVNDGAWSVRNPDTRHPLSGTEFVQLRDLLASLGVA